VPHDQITLRIAGAFRAKADVFDRYRRDRHVGIDDACIIAINLRNIPHAWADAEEFWFRAMYGVGDRFVAIDPAGGPAMEGRDHRMLLHRAGGAAEDVAPLLRQERADICAVLGSSANANTPNPLGDDFLLMPHAAAWSPYQRAFIQRGGEILLDDNDAKGWTLENIDHGAHQSRGSESMTVELGSEKVEAE